MRFVDALRWLLPSRSSDNRPSHSRSARTRTRARSHSRNRSQNRSRSHQLVSSPTFLSSSPRHSRPDESSPRGRKANTRSPSGSPPRSPPRSRSYTSGRPAVPSTRPPHPSAHTQERTVIATHRDDVLKHVEKLDNLWRRLEAEPDDAGILLHLRKHSRELENSLECYFAAQGSRSTAELPGVVSTVKATDRKMSQLDQQIRSEVNRFDDEAASIKLRFDTSPADDRRVHICADADDALIELQLYDHSWGNVMDENTRNKLLRAAEVLRGVLQSAPTNRVAPMIEWDDFAEVEFTPSPPAPSSHLPRHQHYPHLDTYSPKSNKLAQPLQVKRSPSNTTASKLPSFPKILTNPVFPDLPEHQQYSPNHVRNGMKDQSRNQTSYRMDSRGSTSESLDRSGRNTMQRQRTLRDKAQTVWDSDNDSSAPLATLGPSFMHGLDVPTPPASASVSASTTSAPGTQSSVPHSASASASRSASTSRGTGRQSLNAGADLEAINPTVSKNMSFASTLYHTNNARVDAISDVGIMLERSEVRGDGRCLFRSLARCRAVAKGEGILEERDEREEADILRLRAVAEQKRHRDLLTRNFVIEDNFEQHVKKMALPQTFGGEPELLMLAKVLHVPIAVYIAKGDRYRQIQVYGRWYRGDPLRILYHSDGVHYDALLPCH